MAISAPVAKLSARFSEQFEALTETTPYPWQEGLFELFIRGEFPPDINLPTGSGKTSIIPIWLLAIAHQVRESGTVTLPRRLVWVVNRRVVVDQATAEAERIRGRIADKDGRLALSEVREGLRKLSRGYDDPELIAVSTLRGENEDNREWSEDPSRPAIIVGTVDMIGSRLLFSGYGDSRYWRAQHAGILGHDALIVNDEAHLTPAFAELIRTIESVQNEGLKPFRTIRLSATHPDANCWPDSLNENKRNPRFDKIYSAKKKLYVQVHAAARIESAVLDLATERGVGRTIVFVTEPEKAQKLTAAIKKRVGADSAKRLLTLTGTMRGFERDELVKKDEFKVFAAAKRPAEDYWLVATSAGEVGVNISADRLVTTLDTLEHLLQRFGRLNRFGETEGVAYLISSDKEKSERKMTALDFLRTQLPVTDDGYDISPEALFGVHLDEDACTEPPLIAALHPWHVDVWSQTSVGSHPSRPGVASWLHGKEEDNFPETFLAWREDVRVLESPDERLISNDDREEILGKYPLLGHEQLREPTHKLVAKLAALFSTTERKTRVWRRKPDGTTDVIEFPRIRRYSDGIPHYVDIREDRDAEAARRELAYCQLVFPPGCGKPEDGMFEPTWDAVAQPVQVMDGQPLSGVSSAYDISGAQLVIESGTTREARASFLAVRQQNGEWLLSRLGGAPQKSYSPEPLKELTRSELSQLAVRHGWRFLLEVGVGRGEQDQEAMRNLLYFGPAKKRSAAQKEILSLTQHNSDVATEASGISGSLMLPPDIVLALRTAGELHDLGKLKDIWQKAAGNWDWQKGTQKHEPVAKPIDFMRGRQLGGFRHELASVRQAKEHPALAELGPEVCELVLQLIAAHHGHGRPCFESTAYDREELRGSDALAQECTDRFARLQQQYGAWGLAYLESILRAADGIVSQHAQEQPTGA